MLAGQDRLTAREGGERGGQADTVTMAAATRAALPQSIGRRRGTAANVVLISPVAYSPLTSRTPSTPTAI